MPRFIGYTLAGVDAALSGNPATTVGLYRHYAIIPPAGSNGPANDNDRVVSQSPVAGYCSTTSLGSTLDLEYP
jgi:hypothetical protein